MRPVVRLAASSSQRYQKTVSEGDGAAGSIGSVDKMQSHNIDPEDDKVAQPPSLHRNIDLESVWGWHCRWP